MNKSVERCGGGTCGNFESWAKCGTWPDAVASLNEGNHGLVANSNITFGFCKMSETSANGNYETTNGSTNNLPPNSNGVSNTNTVARPDPALVVAGIIALFQSALAVDPTPSRENSENDPLLPQDRREERRKPTPVGIRATVWALLVALFVAALVVFLRFEDKLEKKGWDRWGGWRFGERLPRDPVRAAKIILDKAPVIDGHIDLPELARTVYANNVSSIDLNSPMPAQVDIPRLREGKVGGFFWSVYVACPDPLAEGKDFLGASWRVRDTLEQIDVAHQLIDKYPETFQLALNSNGIRQAVENGKIASLLGVEGAHQLGNSIAVLRQYAALGVRYVTLTHGCNNAFADSSGFIPDFPSTHGGLSSLGRTLIREMNRLGVLVDLSHTSDATATQAFFASQAPVIWSHSSARAVYNHPRNVPDEILELIKHDKDKDAIVMVNFAPYFVAENGKATVEVVADHVEHIGRVAGKKHVGIGSDFDGIGAAPKGLENVSKYPQLFAELYSRGWNKFELADLAGGNLLRVLEGAERVAHEMRLEGVSPAYDVYEKRTDLPTTRRVVDDL